LVIDFVKRTDSLTVAVYKARATLAYAGELKFAAAR
jgi:hypothetical protein